MEDWVYDIETYPNIFSAVFVSTKTTEAWVFECSDRRNDLKAFRQFMARLYKNKDRMIGYNNVGFDYPVIHYILKNKHSRYKEIYDYAMDVISAKDDDKFKYTVSEKKMFVKQIDLYKIHHFDNMARATSLKMLEFNMRSKNIEDLPFPVGKELTNDEKDVLITYNKHDVLQTYEFYKHSLKAISFRENLSDKYGKSFINYNDGKIGKEYFKMRLEEEMPGCLYRVVDGKRKLNQTWRKEIDIGEIIFPYIKFESPEFNAVLDWFKSKKITETKGVLSDIPEHELGKLAKYCNMRKKSQKLKGEPNELQVKEWQVDNPSLFIEERELKSGKTVWYKCWRVADGLNCVIDGFQYDFGLGGIHASIESETVHSDEDWVVRDFDYASYYPWLTIANRVYPEHLSDVFCDVYHDVYQQRKSYAKGTDENDMMKLALNSVYGDSNSRFSPFYDPKYTMTITINGQLTLCCLAEKLMKVEGLRMIQCNTDGLTVRHKREDLDRVNKIVADWDKITGLDMEAETYQTMAIATVNNYIAVYENGKVKRNGQYEYKINHLDDEGLGWHQNQSSVVVAAAAFHEVIEGGSAEDFIRNHKNHMDFMLRTKVPRSSRLELVTDGVVSVEQNICRYYISNSGGSLVKVMPPLDKVVIENVYADENNHEVCASTKADIDKCVRKGYTFVKERQKVMEERRIGIDSRWLVTTCNDMDKFKGDINYDYYIEEARKLIDPLIGRVN